MPRNVPLLQLSFPATVADLLCHWWCRLLRAPALHPACTTASSHQAGVPLNWKLLDRSKLAGGAGIGVDITASMKDSIEWLMNKTAEQSSHRVGKDSHSVKFDKFVVKRVDRAQNKDVWSRYPMKLQMGEPPSSALLTPDAKNKKDNAPLPTQHKFRIEKDRKGRGQAGRRPVTSPCYCHREFGGCHGRFYACARLACGDGT